MRFTFIGQHRRHWPLTFQCRALGVTRHGYGVWRKRQRQPSARQQEDARLLLQIKAVHRRGRGNYGSPRIFRALRDQGVRVSRKRIARLMREAGLKGVWRGRRQPRTTNSNHRLPIASNLLERRFSLEQVGSLNQAWCGDITYIATTEGWLYLAGCPLGGFKIYFRVASLAGHWGKALRRSWCAMLLSGLRKLAVLLV